MASDFASELQVQHHQLYAVGRDELQVDLEAFVRCGGTAADFKRFDVSEQGFVDLNELAVRLGSEISKADCQEQMGTLAKDALAGAQVAVNYCNEVGASKKASVEDAELAFNDAQAQLVTGAENRSLSDAEVATSGSVYLW